MKIIFRYLLLGALLFFCNNSTAQESQKEVPSLGHEVDGIIEAQHEELHRYMGYERLLPKYISLPYDVNVNTNIRGSFVDISYLYLMFIPIILIIGIKKNTWKLVYCFLLALFYLISNVTAYSAFYRISVFESKRHIDQVLAALPFSESPIMNLKIGLTQFLATIYLPLDSVLSIFSGEGDAVTMPLLIIIFIGMVLLIWQQFSFSSIAKKTLAYFSMLYGFLWLILSAGVPWYGILLLVLGLIIIGIFYFTLSGYNQLFTKIFLAFSGLWMVFAYTNRLSEYDHSSSGNHKGAINTATLIYGTKKYNEKQVLDILYPSYRKALIEINSDPTAIIFRVGTFMHYFIDRNNERVIVDNQLSYFSTLYNRISNKQDLAKKLKENNCKYIVLDLNTATIDATVDKSLTKKYNKMVEFLTDNPAIQLIATDRKIKDGRLEKNGSFAAYKII